MVPERLGGLPRGTGGISPPPREPLESVFPPSRGPWALGPTQREEAMIDYREVAGAKPSSVDPCSGGGNTATESKLVANY
jgi:hypothetical protein